MSEQVLSPQEATERLKAIQRVLIHGSDLNKLSEAQREQYYLTVCESIGLNPLTRPLEYTLLNNKLVLYAKKDATDQLRRLYSVSVTIHKEKLDDVFLVTAHATTPNGRVDESLGAVNLGSLKGVDLANAIMKSETKAKRRVTLSICGLGLLDETEVQDSGNFPDGKPEPSFGAVPRKSAVASEGQGGGQQSDPPPPALGTETPKPKQTDFPHGHNLPNPDAKAPSVPVGEDKVPGVSNPPADEPQAVKPPTIDIIPPPQPPTPVLPVKQPKKDKCISKPQRDRLWTLMKESKRSQPDLKSFLRTIKTTDHPDGLESTNDIPANIYEVVCAWIGGGK